MKWKYEYNTEFGVLFKYYYGSIGIDDIIISWKQAFEKQLIPKEVKGFILDYTQASFNLEHHEHVKIAEFYQNNLEVFGNHKFAILTKNPKDIVIPILVKSKDKGYSSRPFTTLPAALNWVLS